MSRAISSCIGYSGANEYNTVNRSASQNTFPVQTRPVYETGNQYTPFNQYEATQQYGATRQYGDESSFNQQTNNPVLPSLNEYPFNNNTYPNYQLNQPLSTSYPQTLSTDDQQGQASSPQFDFLPPENRDQQRDPVFQNTPYPSQDGYSEPYSANAQEEEEEEPYDPICNGLTQTNTVPVKFEDIYRSKTCPDGTRYYGIQGAEGGYSDRESDSGRKTNYGITQGSLNEYATWPDPRKSVKVVPKNVEDIPPELAKTIMDEMYYQRYGFNKLTNIPLLRTATDFVINQGTDAGKILADSINEVMGTHLPRNIVMTDKVAQYINNLSPEDTKLINDLYLRKRMEQYFKTVDNENRGHRDIDNLRGWYNRLTPHYSSPEEFEKMYKDQVENYIKVKYKDYYTGK